MKSSKKSKDSDFGYYDSDDLIEDDAIWDIGNEKPEKSINSDGLDDNSLVGGKSINIEDSPDFIYEHTPRELVESLFNQDSSFGGKTDAGTGNKELFKDDKLVSDDKMYEDFKPRIRRRGKDYKTPKEESYPDEHFEEKTFIGKRNANKKLFGGKEFPDGTFYGEERDEAYKDRGLKKNKRYIGQEEMPEDSKSSDLIRKAPMFSAAAAMFVAILTIAMLVFRINAMNEEIQSNRVSMDEVAKLEQYMSENEALKTELTELKFKLSQLTTGTSDIAGIPQVGLTPETDNDDVAGNDSETQKPAQTPNTYVVKSGDTFSKISREVYGNPDLYQIIMDANNIRDARSLPVGKELIIPQPD